MKHRIKTIVLYALPYVLAFFGLLFRKKQLDNDSALFTPIQFEFITWIEFVIVILLAQVFYVRNKRLAEEKARIGAEKSCTDG